MKTMITDSSVSVWISARETSDWATRPGHSWPGSQLRGRRLFAAFDRNGLCDISVDGGKGDQDIDSNEFNACTSDFLRSKVPPEHPCFHSTVSSDPG